MLKPSLWVLGVVIVYGLAVLFRFYHVHAESGEWRDRPTAQPPIVRYHGHVYDRASADGARRARFTRHGIDVGGGVIYAPLHVPDPKTIEVDAAHVYRDYRLAS